MIDHLRLIKIAEETVAAVKRGTYVAPSSQTVDFAPLMQRCLDGTLYYPSEALDAIRDQVLAQPAPYDRTEFELVNETTLQGSARIVEGGQYRHIGVLNFASAKNPGGGFLGGARAQEKSLARSSGLYRSLQRRQVFYQYHRQLRTTLYSDAMIFSPHCPILRTDAGDWLETPFAVSFITSAAPNAGAIEKNEPHNLAQIPATFRQRIGKVLALAAHQNCDALVLGAWGCGAFRNDPEIVAPIFREHLDRDGAFYGRFKKVQFSVLDTSKAQNIYNVFARSLADLL